MTPKIEIVSTKKLVGKYLEMSLTDNKTGVLWGNFMQQRHKIENIKGSDLYSIQVYPNNYFKDFNPTNNFKKWAVIEVTDFESIPLEMETFILSVGLYAVFTYQGLSTDTRIFEHIYNEWLPNSDFILDDRPHFEVLGKKYKNNKIDSEELIYIPIKVK